MDETANRRFYAERGIGARVGFGSRPALLVFDFVVGFTSS